MQSHTLTHTHTHTPCRCIPTITVQGTLLRKCCVCICSECVYSPERVIYFSNLPLSSSQRNRTLSTSEHSSPGLRGTGPVVQHVLVSISFSHYLRFTLFFHSSPRSAFPSCFFSPFLLISILYQCECCRDRRRGRAGETLTVCLCPTVWLTFCQQWRCGRIRCHLQWELQ